MAKLFKELVSQLSLVPAHPSVSDSIFSSFSAKIERERESEVRTSVRERIGASNRKMPPILLYSELGAAVCKPKLSNKD